MCSKSIRIKVMKGQCVSVSHYFLLMLPTCCTVHNSKLQTDPLEKLFYIKMRVIPEKMVGDILAAIMINNQLLTPLVSPYSLHQISSMASNRQSPQCCSPCSTTTLLTKIQSYDLWILGKHA